MGARVLEKQRKTPRYEADHTEKSRKHTAISVLKIRKLYFESQSATHKPVPALICSHQ